MINPQIAELSVSAITLRNTRIRFEFKLYADLGLGIFRGTLLIDMTSRFLA